MFSLLNHFHLNNNDLLNDHKNIYLNNFSMPTFFTLFKIDPYSKRYNTFDTINIITITYNMPNFFYKTYLKSGVKERTLERSLYDYLMHSSSIILSDYELLDFDTSFFYKEFDEEYLRDIVDFEEYDTDNDLYNNYVYTYLFRNFLIMVGKQILKDDDRYEENIRLSTISITLDLRNVIYEIMEQFKRVLLNKYRKNLTTEKVNSLVNVIYPIYEILKRYMINHLNLSIDYVYKEKTKSDYDRDYESDCEDYDDEDCYDYYDEYYEQDNEESEESIRYVNNLYLFFLLDYGSQNFIFKANFKYWFEEVFGQDENGLMISFDPFTLDVTLFKAGKNMKILLSVVIEKNIKNLNKVVIYKKEIVGDRNENMKYILQENDDFCVIKIYEEFEYVEDNFFVNLSKYFNDIFNYFSRIFAVNIIN